MKKWMVLILLAGLVFSLAACSGWMANALGGETGAQDQSSGGGKGQGMDPGMGGGHGPQAGMGGMHARHMAQIPGEYAGQRSPVVADDESLARGQEVYEANCATCHGDGGMGDGPAGAALDPPPAGVAHTSQMMGDDYLFWRISEGGLEAPFNSSMPAFKDTLDETERWDVIQYIRALGRGDVRPGRNMGGARFDPEVEAAHRVEMLSEAVDQGVITQDEADNFDLVHAAMDEYLGEQTGGFTGRMGDVKDEILAALVASGVITQEQADVFDDVHDLLEESGLMQ